MKTDELLALWEQAAQLDEGFRRDFEAAKADPEFEAALAKSRRRDRAERILKHMLIATLLVVVAMVFYEVAR